MNPLQHNIEVVDAIFERVEKQLPLNRGEFELMILALERLGLCVAPSFEWVN